jgi:hypothetical protein
MAAGFSLYRCATKSAFCGELDGFGKEDFSAFGGVVCRGFASGRGGGDPGGGRHVNSALPAVNSGAISNLNVGNGYTALLQFDLSTLPAGTTAAQVSRAVLRLY